MHERASRRVVRRLATARELPPNLGNGFGYGAVSGNATANERMRAT